jgi:hypothetical protein
VPRNLAAVLLQGSDTLSAALHAAVIFLARYPHVLKKAQEEVDRVVGTDRMPTLTDMPNLPYVNAIMEEVSFSLPASLPFDFSNAGIVQPSPSNSTSQPSS